MCSLILNPESKVWHVNVQYDNISPLWDRDTRAVAQVRHHPPCYRITKQLRLCVTIE